MSGGKSPIFYSGRQYHVSYESASGLLGTHDLIIRLPESEDGL